MKRLPQIPALVLVALVACLVLVSAYCTDRDGGSFGGDFDELVLQNPAYMLAHFGRLSMPVGDFESGFDGPLLAHPPIHVGSIGMLLRAGFSIYYAEATPTVLLLFLALAVIVRSRFAAPAKLGLIFSIGFLASSGETLTLLFGTRPEGEVHAAWILGLVLLESGRLDNWNRARLFAGAFFLTWASGTHYYAAAAFIGVGVYVVWVLRSLGWREGRGRITALCAGGCLFGIPYLTLFLLPALHGLQGSIASMQGEGGIGLSLTRHLALYREWAHSLDHPALVRMAMAAGVPLVVFSTAILVMVRDTRGLALAALPLQLFILLFCLHKPPFYLVHESVMFVTALAIGLLVCVERIAERLHLGRVFQPAAVATLGAALLLGSPMLARAEISLRPKVHEAVLARAASRQILGPDARISGRAAAWYASGGAHWHDITRDNSPNSLLFDRRTYFLNLDAAVDYVNNSEIGLAPWYADGTLQLRGFFFGETSDQLRLVYLNPRRPPAVSGYLVRNRQLYRFQEDAGGDHAVLSAECGIGHTAWLWPWRSTASSILHLPNYPDGGTRYMVTILAPKSSMAPEGEIGRGCREVSKAVGSLRPVDQAALLNGFVRNDPPMHFYRLLDQMPGYSGVGLPASAAPPVGAIPVAGVIDLSKAYASSPQSRVERTPELRIATAPGLGAFSAFLPVTPQSVDGPCWVTLRLRVLSGHIGFAAYDSRKGILARTPAIAGSPAPQTIALEVPNLPAATHIVIFNESTLPDGGLVEILDAAVLVMRRQGL